jgi:hypothetical protein
MRVLPLVLLLAWLSLLPQPVAARPAEEETNLPADLALLPGDTCAVLCVHPADLLAGEVGRSLRELEGRRYPLQEFTEEAPDDLTAGIPLAEVERLTVFGTDTEPFWMVTTLGRLDREQVLRNLGNKAAQTKLRGLSYHAAPENSVLFVGERTFLTGRAKAVEACFGRENVGRPTGLLAEAVREAAGKRHVVAAFGGPRFKGGLPNLLELPSGLAMLKPLLRAESALVAFQFGKEFELDLGCTFGDEPQAEKAETAAGAFRDLGVKHLPDLGDVLAERFLPAGGPGRAKEVLRFFEAAEPSLKGLRIQREGKGIRLGLRTPGRGAAWAMLMLCMPGMTSVSSDTPSARVPSSDPPQVPEKK